MTRIAIPAISTGIYGFPADLAAGISIREIMMGAAVNPELTDVHLVFTETGKYNLTRQVFDSVMMRFVPEMTCRY